jgi:hypothetical protein
MKKIFEESYVCRIWSEFTVFAASISVGFGLMLAYF